MTQRVAMGLILASAALTAAAGDDAPGRLVARPDAFPTLVNPECSHCVDEAKRRADQLRDDDRVLCWIRGKYQGGAIPLRFFLVKHRVISDTYGVFVHDPDAGFVRAFEPSLDFSFHGWRHGIMVIRHKDGTLYSALSGRAFDGPHQGKNLKAIPALETDWGYWLSQYRDAVAFKKYPRYQPADLPKRIRPESLESRGAADPRLAAEAPVFGVRVGEQTKAYPLVALEKAGVVNDVVGGRRIAVLYYRPTKTAAAFANDRDAPFAVKADNPRAPFVRQDEPGKFYDITGRPEGSRELDGLEWVDGVQVKWFAWAAEYPDTVLHPVK